MKIKINDREIYLDGYLKSNLDLALEMVKADWDMVFVIDGREGSGKSVLAQHIGLYLDNQLDLDSICFNPNEFQKKVTNARRYQVIIFDEAFAINSRSAMSKVNVAICSMLSEIRQKNLFILIVIPSFFDLDKYVSLWRSRALFHVYTGDKSERGFFSMYNEDRKKQLYMVGKKLYHYGVKPNFRGRFTKPYVVDEQQYRQRKLNALKKQEDEGGRSVQENKTISLRNALLKVFRDEEWKYSKIASKVNEHLEKPTTKEALSKMLQREKK